MRGDRLLGANGHWSHAEQGRGAEGEAVAVTNTREQGLKSRVLSRVPPSVTRITQKPRHLTKLSLPPTLLILPPPLVDTSLYRGEKRKPMFSWVPGGSGLGPPCPKSSHQEGSQSLLLPKHVGAAEQITSASDKGPSAKGRSATSPRASAHRAPGEGG